MNCCNRVFFGSVLPTCNLLLPVSAPAFQNCFLQRYLFRSQRSISSIDNCGGERRQKQRLWCRPLVWCTVGVAAAVGLYMYMYNKRDGLWSMLVKTHLVRCSVASSSLKPPANANYIADVVQQIGSAVVFIKVSTSATSLFGMNQGFGSGFIIRNDGLILTNLHVVGPAAQSSSRTKIQVSLTDGRQFDASIVAFDPYSDMALIKINTTDLPVMELGDSSRCRCGEWVIAIGAPLNLTNTVTVGVLSATARNLGTNRGMEYLQTDAAITFGNSGGPLVNLEGKAIGINTLKVDTGFSFAIPIDTAKTFIKLATSTVKQTPSRMKRYLGISMLTLTPNLLTEFHRVRPDLVKQVTRGVLIQSVHQGSPASAAGLRSGDVITSIDGVAVYSTGDVNAAVEKSSGKMVLSVMRAGSTVTVAVTPE